MTITTAAWVAVTFLTPQTDAAKRAEFQKRIHTGGHDIAWGMLAMSIASAAIYALMFAVGCLIYGKTLRAAVLAAVAAVSGLLLVPILKRLNSNTPPLSTH